MSKPRLLYFCDTLCTLKNEMSANYSPLQCKGIKPLLQVKNIFITLLLVKLLLLSTNIISAQTIQSLYANFELTITDSEKNTSNGFLIYKEPGILYLEVTYPINQLMLFKNDTLRIFYPSTERLMEIPNSTYANIPFFKVLINNVEGKIQPIEYGFIFQSSNIKNDTLYITYRPPEQLEKQFGKSVHVYFQRDLFYNYMLDPRNNLIARIDFENYKAVESFKLPHKITIKTLTGKNSFKLEEAVFDSILINKDFDIESYLIKIKKK